MSPERVAIGRAMFLHRTHSRALTPVDACRPSTPVDIERAFVTRECARRHIERAFGDVPSTRAIDDESNRIDRASK